MNELVKYHNDMNKVSFANFKEKELDLFFSICQKMKDKGNAEVQFKFSEIREISQYTNRSIQRLYSDLDRLYKKMLELNLKYEDENILQRFVLFSKYTINKKEKTITIKASEDFEYVLNNLIGNFTKFDLKELISLKSIYSKNLFRLLKQWESVKSKEFTLEEFKNLLSIPKGFAICKIDERVLKPALEELPKYFYDLKLEKIKTGRKVTGLKFTWEDKKVDPISEMEVVESKQIKISRKLFTIIEKARKNRYIQGVLDNKGIAYLVDKFTEEQLIKGLNCAYKEVKQDVGSINYLVTLIENENKKQEIEIIVEDEIVVPVSSPKEIGERVKQEKKIGSTFDEMFEEVPLDFKSDETLKVEKIKITQKEADEIYQKYLKDNGVGDIKPVRIGFEKSVLSKYEIIKDEEKEEKTTPVKVVELEDIPIEKLLSKGGKKLVGGALKEKLKKIAKDENIKIKYKDEIIG